MRIIQDGDATRETTICKIRDSGKGVQLVSYWKDALMQRKEMLFLRLSYTIIIIIQSTLEVINK